MGVEAIPALLFHLIFANQTEILLNLVIVANYIAEASTGILKLMALKSTPGKAEPSFFGELR